MKLKLMSALSIFMLATACSADKEEMMKQEPPKTQVKFAENVLPIFTKECGFCHGNTNPRKGISLTNHAQISTNADIAYAAIVDGSMPPSGPLSAEQKAIIKAWIDGGKKND